MLDAVALFISYYVYLTAFNLGAIPDSYSFTLLFDGGIVHIATTALVGIYILISLSTAANPAKAFKTKLTILFLLIALTVILTSLNLIDLRRQTEPFNYIHDHPLQIEEALKFLTTGKNPYTVDYSQTPLPKWENWSTNPAIHHFISLPSTLYLSLPIFLVWQPIFGWYDQRIVHIIFLLIALVSAYELIEQKELKLLALIAIAFNPPFIHYLILGTTDIMFLGTILLSILLLKKKKILYSLITLAFAITTKHTAWFILPFYFYHLYQSGYLKKKAFNNIVVFPIVVAILIAPFILWDGNAFFQDIYSYPAGTLPTSYPIAGLGISTFLVEKGIIPNFTSYYPFAKLQLIFLIPLLILLLKIQKKHPTLSQMMINYGVLLWIFWYLSRFFNITYVGILAVIFALAAVLRLDEQSKVQPDAQLKTNLT